MLTVGLMLAPVTSSSTGYYLHIPECTQDFSTPPANLSLSLEQTNRGTSCPVEILSTAYVWTASPVDVSTSYPSGTWQAVLWLNTTGTLTEYNVSLGIIDQFGNFTQVTSANSPVIDTAAATAYTVNLPANNVTLDVGSSLALSLVNQDDQGNTTDPGFIFLDSASTPSHLLLPTSSLTSETTSISTLGNQTSTGTQSSNPETTTPTVTYTATTTVQVMSTTTESPQIVTSAPSPVLMFNQPTSTNPQTQPPMNLGIVLLIIGIGAGASVVIGAITLVKVTKTKSVQSEITVNQGSYYCRKHHVPLTLRSGRYWCPIEKRPLNL